MCEVWRKVQVMGKVWGKVWEVWRKVKVNVRVHEQEVAG